MTNEISTTNGIFKEEVIIIKDGIELKFPLSQAKVSLSDSDADIFEAISSLLIEEDKRIDNLSSLYKVHRSNDTGKLFIIPQSVAGMPF